MPHQRKEWSQPDIMCVVTINYYKTLLPMFSDLLHQLQRMNRVREASTINPVTMELQLNVHPYYQLLGSKQLFRFIFRCSILILPIIQFYKQRIVCATNLLTTEIMDNSCNSQLALKPTHVTVNQYLQGSGGGQRCMHCRCCSWHVLGGSDIEP